MPGSTMAVVIICGGRSSRMGRSKALLSWNGQPMIRHLVDTLRELSDSIVVVASETQELPHLDARVVRDRQPGLGPLGGIREGLHAVESDRALITSTDAPLLSATFARGLLSRKGTVACRVGGLVQPFPAVYETSLATAADSLIAEGRMRPLFLLEERGFVCIEEADLDNVDAFRTFNTPEEYLVALKTSAQPGSVTVEFGGTRRKVAPGTLRDVIASLDVEAEFSAFRISLNGSEPVENPDVPVGPGERLQVTLTAS